MAHRLESIKQTDNLPMQQIEWMGIRFDVPARWSIIRHSLAPDRGNLALADRYRQRLQVIWTQCRKRPDLAKMISDHRSRQQESDSDAVFRPLKAVSGWRGLSREREPGVWLTRAAHYDPQTKRLVEVILLSRDDEPGDLLHQVLRSLSVVSPPRDATRWCAFGLDVTVPVDWRLVKAQIKPADVTLKFRWVKPNSKNDGRVTRKSREATIRRLAMAESWYEDPEHFYLRRGNITDLRLQPARFAGHDATAASGIEKGPPLKRFLGWLRQRHDLLWRCRQDNAIYHILTLAPASDPGNPQQFQVRCCRWHRETSTA